MWFLPSSVWSSLFGFVLCFQAPFWYVSSSLISLSKHMWAVYWEIQLNVQNPNPIPRFLWLTPCLRLFLAWNAPSLTALDILNSKAFCEFICKSNAPSESVDHRESGPTRDRHQACPGGTTLDGGFKKRFEEQKEKNASSETTPFMCSIRTRKTKTGTLQQAAPPPPPSLFKMSFRINCWNYSRKTKLSSALCSIVLHPHGMASTHTFLPQRTHYKPTIPKLKGEFTQKWVFKSIQICTTYFLLWKTKEVIWKNF